MQVDKTTLTDLSIFHNDEEQSVFHHLNFAHTNGGREYFRQILSCPLDSINAIQDTQATIKGLMQVQDQWPLEFITNGTLMVIEKFYETAIDAYPKQPDLFSSNFYKIFHAPDYSVSKYTVTHTIAFLKGMQKIAALIGKDNQSQQLESWQNRIEHHINKPILQEMMEIGKDTKLNSKEVLTYAIYLRNHFRKTSQELIDIFCKLDAYMSMAIACKKFDFVFPEMEMSAQPFVNAKGLYHLLLSTPIAYDIALNKEANFVFLTGANMGERVLILKPSDSVFTWLILAWGYLQRICS